MATARVGGCTVMSVVAALGAVAQDDRVLDVGSRLELFVDRFLVNTLDGLTLKLQEPRPGQIVLKFDNPWEGRFCGYTTVIHDGGRYHLYYRGLPSASPDGSSLETTCYAVSEDGVGWTKPDLGIYEVHGTRKNNVILADSAPLSHNFCPFLDKRPGVPDEERFKAVAGTKASGLVAFVSEDGVHWRKLRETPIITQGAFDSQNLAFWSDTEQCYCCYLRTFVDGYRWIARATSKDFLNWSETVNMDFGDAPREHLYTNQTAPYFRTPHIYIAVAARFMPGRRVVSPEKMLEMGGNPQYSGDCSDAVLLTSRGGTHYDRTFMEGFVRPGIGVQNWTSRTNYPAYGLVPVGQSEMSFYLNRNYGQDSACLQRFTLRLDGFASVNAPYAGGEMITKPFTFSGKELVMNFATSAAGGVWVEVQDSAGNPIEGYTLEEADENVGDEITRVVTWKGRADVSALVGKPVRLRFKMKDADLYSIQFR